MFAVSSEAQNPAVVKLLLKAGADVNAKSSVGETALDWAMKFGNQEVIAALTAAGARQGVPYAAPQLKPAGTRTVSQAVEHGAAILQVGAAEFFKQSGCVGCHHQPVAALAGAAARGAGVHVDEAAAKGLRQDDGRRDRPSSIKCCSSGMDTGGGTDGPTWKLMALASERYPSSLLTDTLVAYIANFQRHDGSWWFGGVSRAPLEEGADGADRDGRPRPAGLRHARHEGRARLAASPAPAPIWQPRKPLPTTRRRCRFSACTGWAATRPR